VVDTFLRPKRDKSYSDATLKARYRIVYGECKHFL
jgi:hypothetical protein